MKNSKKPIGVLITDTHLNKDNLEDVKSVFKQAINLASELEVKLFHGGDNFTDRTGQTLLILLAFLDILDYAASKGVIISSIDGNHDQQNLDSDNSYLDVFSSHPNLNIHKYGMFKISGVNICMLSYYKENGKYPVHLKNLIKELPEGEKSILITHIAVNGIRNNDGSLVEDGISVKSFKHFNSVYCGHYHNRSKVGNNIYYVGSALQHNFGEDNEKGATILYDDCSHEYIKLKFKEYQKVVIDIGKTSKKELEKIKKEYSNTDNNVRFVLKGTEEQLATVNSKIFKEVGIDVKKESENVLKSIEAAENGEFYQFNKKTIIREFFSYCSNNEINSSDRNTGFKYLNRI